MMDFQDIAVVAAVLLAGAYLFLRIRRTLRGRGCGCGCGPAMPPKHATEALPDSKRQLKVVANRERNG
ncbi:MAG: hypothetical protein IT449_13160 [Phycisphaerales bacterium]|nr:hypothetical protein [Phycisphaerales bacterium]